MVQGFSRRGFLGRLSRLSLFCALGAGISASATGCASGQLLSDLRVSATEISPNGKTASDQSKVGFTLAERADVRAWLAGPDGKEWNLRENRTLAPDDYEIDFRGVITEPNSQNRRVLTDGQYTLSVQASDNGAKNVVKSTQIKISDADTTAPEITNLTSSLPEFSPNGDGDDDEVVFSYGLSKAATTTVYVTDDSASRYLIEAPKKKNAVLMSHNWNGTAGGGKVLNDGKYTFTVDAEDTAGNFTRASMPIKLSNAGTPRLEIVEAKFSPIAIAKGAKLNVRIKVKNNGDTMIRTLGPAPGTEYTTQMNFASIRDPKNPDRALYYEQPGRWRVGVQWTNAPQPYPVRWGLLPDDEGRLAPGDEAMIVGTIEILEQTTHELTFWAAIVQEGVGFPGGAVGHTVVKVSF